MMPCPACSAIDAIESMRNHAIALVRLTLRKSDARLTVVVPARANQGNAVRAPDPGRAIPQLPPQL